MQVELPLECIPQVMNTQTDIFPQQLAIHLRDVNLVYSTKNVLSGLCLSVPRGSMYGLLGPSGCGKTVLIRCILGTAKPTSGSIEVSGHKPGKSHSVGYMPQHIALFPQLTIRETFNYFGSIYGLEQAQLNEQSQSLIESLHLPTQTDQLVGLLSGDQKRRLSLAIALIHKPKLLILDEPTRGMDPLIRNFIWGHLVNLSLTKDLTVLVTSSYFEEFMDRANMIGIMRNGHILAQDNPSSLLDRFQMNTLEHVFFHLSTKAEAATDDVVNPNVEQAPEKELSISELSHQSSDSSSFVESILEVIVVKNEPQQSTEAINESQMDSVTDISVAEVVIDYDVNPNVEQVGTLEESQKSSSSRVESVPEVVVVVEDNESQQPTEPIDEFQMDSVPDTPVVSKCTQMVAMVTKNIRTLFRNKLLTSFQFGLPTVLLVLFCLWCIDTLQMDTIPVAVYNGDHSRLCNELINKLDQNILNLQMYNSESDAISAVRMGKASTALVIYDNFLYNYSNIYYTQMQHMRDIRDHIESNSTEILRNSSIHLYPGMSNQMVTLTSVYDEVVRVFSIALKTLYIDINPKIFQVPVLIEKPIHREPVPSSFSLTPGMISTIAFFSAIPLTCITLLTEKKNGLIERTLVSGVSYFHILLSHLIPQTVILFLQMMSLVLVAFPLFGIPFHFQYLLAMSLLSLQSVCGMCFGLFVSTIARYRNIAIMAVLGLFYLNLMLNGTLFSIGAMIDYVISGYQFGVICAFSLTLFWSGIFLLAAIWMARFCL